MPPFHPAVEVQCHPADRVLDEVRAFIPRGQPELVGIARHLGTSRRSLQRALQRRGTSFSAIVDYARAELAQECLADASKSIGSVAYLLGFSDVRAFNRAFKRWTKLTPRQFRDAKLAGSFERHRGEINRAERLRVEVGDEERVFVMRELARESTDADGAKDRIG